MYWPEIKRKCRHGIYYTRLEYWIGIDDIVVSPEMAEEKISERRYKREVNYLNDIGLFATRIILDRDFNLIDGYISILIAKENGDTKVPVNFIAEKSWGTKE